LQVLNRTIRVDHCENYKPPKDSEKIDDETRKLYQEGCAPGSAYGEKRGIERQKDPGLTKVKEEATADQKRKLLLFHFLKIYSPFTSIYYEPQFIHLCKAN